MHVSGNIYVCGRRLYKLWARVEYGMTCEVWDSRSDRECDKAWYGSVSSLVPVDDTSLYSTNPFGCYSRRISLTPGAALDYIPNTFLHSLIFPQFSRNIAHQLFSLTRIICLDIVFDFRRYLFIPYCKNYLKYPDYLKLSYQKRI